MDNKKKWYAALTYYDFRLLWGGELISAIGTDMQFVAMSWQLYLLTDSAFALGLVGLARFLPILLFSLIGGTFADVHNRKKILYVTQSIIALSSLVLAITTFTNTITPLLMYTITAIVAAAISFDLPARQALIPNLVERKDLQNALSLYGVVWEASRVLGPSIAGFLIAFHSIGVVYLIDFFTTLAVLVALFLMRNDGQPTGQKVVLSFTSVKEGLRFVKSKTIIWSTMLLDFFCTFFASAMALLPIYAKDILGVGPQGLGLLVAAPSVGAVIAAFFMARYGHNVKEHGKVLIVSVVIYAIATIMFGISTGFLASLVGAPISVAIGGVATLAIVGIMAMVVPTMRSYKLRLVDHAI